jgi:hypothetical protein
LNSFTLFPSVERYGIKNEEQEMKEEMFQKKRIYFEIEGNRERDPYTDR